MQIIWKNKNKDITLNIENLFFSPEKYHQHIIFKNMMLKNNEVANALVFVKTLNIVRGCCCGGTAT